MKSQISVIIPTYKRPATLLQTLDSLQSQTCDGFDIIAIDNAVDPDVQRRINQFNTAARVPVRYIAEPHAGVIFARHTGARASTSDLLVFADDDVMSCQVSSRHTRKPFRTIPTWRRPAGRCI